MPEYSYVRVYAGEQGESHFEKVAIELAESNFAPPAPPVFTGAVQDATNIMFFSAPAAWDGTWHPAPRRQFMAVLKGAFEVEVSDGESRTFGPGDLALLEDLTGKGHYTKTPATSDENLILITQLPDAG